MRLPAKLRWIALSALLLLTNRVSTQTTVTTTEA